MFLMVGLVFPYLFAYKNDFQKALNSYFELTGYPALPPRFAFGVWWNKNEAYNRSEIESLIGQFRRSEIPLSVLLLGEYERTRNRTYYP